MLRHTTILAVALAYSAVAHAQDLPRLDPTGECRQNWTKAGVLDNEMYAYCLRKEQTAYDSLKLNWQSLSTNVRSVCIGEWGKAVGGSYEMLQYCANKQTQAERQNSSSSFRW